MDNIRTNKAQKGEKRISRTQKILNDIKRKNNDEKREIWRMEKLSPKKDFDKIEKILDHMNKFKVKVYRTNNQGYGPDCSMQEPLKFDGELDMYHLQKYLGEKMKGFDQIKKVEKFSYGMLFKTNDYDIFVNNPFLEEKINKYKIVEVIYSKLYKDDNSFLEEYKEENNKTKLSNKEIEQLEEDKNEYYVGEWWSGMKTSVCVGDYDYKVHQDHDNNEFIVEHGYSKKYDKFRYPIDFSEEEEYSIKQKLLYKTV